MNEQEKQQAVDILGRRLKNQRQTVAGIEPRLEEYFIDLWANPNDHNGYEILCAVKFLRLLRTYEFNHKKVRQVIRLREGEWQQDRQGTWRHVRGGISQPGTSGPMVYRWQPFQVFVLASVFGFRAWIDTQLMQGDKAELLPTERITDDGHIEDLRRLCTDFTFFAPRKTDKTGLSAFIQVVFFLLEDQNSESYCCANSSDQSKLLYQRTVGMLRQLDDGHRLRITQTVADWRPAFQSVRCSSIRPLSAGGKTKDGMFAQLCCADEYGSAAYTNGKSDMKMLVDVVSSSMGPRREPMVFTTTTAGRVVAGPFIEKLESLHQLLMKELEWDSDDSECQLTYDRTLCICFEPDDWEKQDEEFLLTSKELRKKINPMLGRIVQHQFYDDGAAKARLEGDTGEFISKYINVYQSATVAEWINPEQIRALQTDMRIDDCTVEKGWDVYAAFDFSHGDDFDAVTFLAYNIHTHEYFADCDAWVNREAFNKSPFRPLYEKWKSDGWLHVSGENVVEPEAPIARVMELDEKHINFKAFGYDSYQSKEPILLLNEWLINQVGISKPETMVVAVSQTFANYNAAVQKIDYCIDGVVPLHFSRSPLWTWEFGNCVLAVDPRMENKKMVKRSANLKVDNVQCLASCFNLEEKFCI